MIILSILHSPNYGGYRLLLLYLYYLFSCPFQNPTFALTPLTPGHASSPWWPTKICRVSPFSRGNTADMNTPWLRLLWFLAPFPPAAP